VTDSQQPMPASPLIIRASDFGWLLRCVRRVWLDTYGAADEQVAPPQTAQAKLDYGRDHEAHVLSAADGAVNPIPVANWSDAVAITRDLMAQGVDVIQQGCLEATIQLDYLRPIRVMGRVDRLQRSRRNSFYKPIEIKSYAQIGQADQLQLDCYCWLLSQLQDYTPDGEFWLGRDDRDTPAEIHLHEYNEARFLRYLGVFAHILSDESQPPPAVMRRVCSECPWKAHCPTLPDTDHDLRLLPRLTEKTFHHLEQRGVTTLADIAALTPDDLRGIRGIKSTANIIHAHARAFVENKPIRLCDDPPPLPETAYFFDIETVPFSNQVWAIGWGAADDLTHVGVVAPRNAGHSRFLSDDLEVLCVESPDALWRLLAAHIPAQTPQLFHWSGFDAGNMRQTAPLDARHALEHQLVDLMALFQKQLRLPVSSDSLKEVAPYFGFRWVNYANYAQAYDDYRRWLVSGRDAHLANAALYQADDVKAMRVIWRYLRRDEQPR